MCAGQVDRPQHLPMQKAHSCGLHTAMACTWLCAFSSSAPPAMSVHVMLYHKELNTYIFHAHDMQYIRTAYVF